MKFKYRIHFSIVLIAFAFVLIVSCGGGSNGGGGFDVEALRETIKLLGGDTEDFDGFGWSVSLDGDDLLAGAPFRAEAGSQRGAAYLLSRDMGGPGNWGQVKKLTPSDPEDFDHFGFSVSISGDIALVGSFRKNEGGTERGAAYVFGRNEGGPGNWGEVKKLAPSDPEDGAFFGYSVAVNGDFAIVGAFRKDGGALDSGAAYVFERNLGGADNWGQRMKLTPSDPEEHAFFGFSVAISGDDAAVGAPFKQEGGFDRGAAYAFNRNQGGANAWGEVKRLTPTFSADFDNFGYSVTIKGDNLIAGAPYADGDGMDRGAAYVFGRDKGGADNWGEVKTLTASDPEDDDFYGWVVSGEIDGVIIGAYKAKLDGIPTGAVYAYSRNEGGLDNWGQTNKLIASDGEENDAFGSSVSVSGDSAVVGAPEEDGSGTNRGSVYQFDIVF